MIELWSWPTPNGWKVHIALEELELPYQAIPVDIGAGEQFRPEFLAINPNHRIPAIVDPDGPGGERITLFESGAILLYLAEKAGRLIPTGPAAHWATVQWLMFQMGGVGPMFGQFNHFTSYAPEKLPYAVDRYTNEMKRLTGVLDRRLAEAEFLAGAYSIADIATYPWIAAMTKRSLLDLSPYPNVARWEAAVGGRPAVIRGMDLMKEQRRAGPMSEAQREILFGKTQFAPR